MPDENQRERNRQLYRLGCMVARLAGIQFGYVEFRIREGKFCGLVRTEATEQIPDDEINEFEKEINNL